MRLTVDAWALKDLACFTARTHAIAFDLQIRSWFWDKRWKLTFRFRHDLQFMDSRGSAVTRRGVSRSILTVGREITEDMINRYGVVDTVEEGRLVKTLGRLSETEGERRKRRRGGRGRGGGEKRRRREEEEKKDEDQLNQSADSRQDSVEAHWDWRKTPMKIIDKSRSLVAAVDGSRMKGRDTKLMRLVDVGMESGESNKSLEEKNGGLSRVGVSLA
jgi:hypothetical protein